MIKSNVWVWIWPNPSCVCETHRGERKGNVYLQNIGQNEMLWRVEPLISNWALWVMVSIGNEMSYVDVPGIPH